MGVGGGEGGGGGGGKGDTDFCKFLSVFFQRVFYRRGLTEAWLLLLIMLEPGVGLARSVSDRQQAVTLLYVFILFLLLIC